MEVEVEVEVWVEVEVEVGVGYAQTRLTHSSHSLASTPSTAAW